MKEKSCILVVDDEPEIRALLQRILTQEGYRVALATDGKSALALMDTSNPDLVILDIMMPGLDGVETLTAMRQWSNVPVLMLSARQETSVLSRALRLGADDYIRKPFHILELLARVNAKLRRASGGVSVSEIISPTQCER